MDGCRIVRVLVVDDNAIYRDVCSRLLDRQQDIEVVAQAGSLAEARGKLEGVDVAIIDRGLPDGDGLELIGHLRKQNPSAKVLATSLTMEQRHPFEALEAGADGIFDKVAAPAQMAYQIRNVRFG